MSATRFVTIEVTSGRSELRFFAEPPLHNNVSSKAPRVVCLYSALLLAIALSVAASDESAQSTQILASPALIAFAHQVLQADPRVAARCTKKGRIDFLIKFGSVCAYLNQRRGRNLGTR